MNPPRRKKISTDRVSAGLTIGEKNNFVATAHVSLSYCEKNILKKKSVDKMQEALTAQHQRGEPGRHISHAKTSAPSQHLNFGIFHFCNLISCTDFLNFNYENITIIIM